MARIPKPALQSIFDDRIASIYGGMVARVAEKRTAGGRIIRVGRVLPFSREDLAAWALAQFGTVQGIVQCAYCTDYLTVRTFVLDHATPIAAPWNGSLDLDNLALACASDNRRKGRMSAAGFRALVGWGVQELDARDFADMLGRMANGGANLKLKLGREAAARSFATTTRVREDRSLCLPISENLFALAMA